MANNSFNRTWATRGAMPPPAPYYRAGGPYPAGRAPISNNYNRNNVNNVNVNNVNVNNVNRNNTNVNRNTANANGSGGNNRNVGQQRGEHPEPQQFGRQGGTRQPEPQSQPRREPACRGKSRLQPAGRCRKVQCIQWGTERQQ